MIDKEILDAVIPVPTLEEAKDEKVAELKEEGFVVTNFHSGGVLYTKRNFDDEFIWSKTVTAPLPGAPRLHGRPGQMPKTRRRDGTVRKYRLLWGGSPVGNFCCLID